MYINRIKVNGYKNLENIDVELDPVMNVICGENAQGKTNLIEALWLCTGCNSFRGTKEKDFIGFDKDNAEISAVFTNPEREQEIEIELKRGMSKDKFVKLNGVPQQYLSSLFGNLRCVIFTPEDLNLAKGSPEKRRSFLDMSVSQIELLHIENLRKYSRVIDQRNKILKLMSKSPPELIRKQYIQVWNEFLSKVGPVIEIQRYLHCAALNHYAKSLYSALTDEKEELEIKYHSSIYQEFFCLPEDRGKMEDIYREKINSNEDTDIRAGYTILGPHREDMEIYINGLPVREFASQGQARSVALALKFAQAKIIQRKMDDSPIMLLDDVLSELDESRQKFILTHTSDMQVIITCCDSNFITDRVDGKVIKIKDGKVI